MPGLDILWAFVIQGLAFGAMYAVTGTGIVVLYRTTGVVNLAFGAIGAMGAHVAWSFMGGSLKKPTPIATGWQILGYPLLIAVSALLTLLYGMVGVALLLLGFMKERWDSSKPRGISFPKTTFKLWGATVTTTQVVALSFAILVVVSVTLFLQRTATGTAMRAIANDRDTAALLGIPVRRIESIAWLTSGVICGCVFVILPDLFKRIDQGTLTWFVIGALGGAIVGQLKSLWITFFASMAIGLIESILTPFEDPVAFLGLYRKLTPFVVAVVAIMWISRKRTIVLAGREMR
jgi:branched-chain amino acid transport system permease protein